MISYKNGNLLDQKGILVHCVNDAGCMGAGVAKALYTKWSSVREQYIIWSRKNNSPEYVPQNLKFVGNYDNPFKLGRIQVIGVEKDVYVCNLIGQSDPGGYLDLEPIRYQSLYEGFLRLKELNKKNNIPIHMPRIGCSLAGGSWKVVSELIDKAGINCTIWDIDNNWNP